MVKKLCSIILAVILLAMACGCQQTPEKSVVVSKNDGAFEDALQNTNDTDSNETAQTAITYTDSYTSADGSISYEIRLEDTSLPDGALPVLQVTPHSFTAEEAERIARALFGDATLYEYSVEKSKAELEDTILSLKQHISDRAALVAYYGGDEATADRVTADYEARIAVYEQEYENASDTVTAQLCDWEFHPYTYYIDPALGMSDDEELNKTVTIKATAVVDGMPYTFNVYNRDEDDYRIHNLSVFLTDSSVQTGDQYLQEPTQADIENAKETAEALLTEMEIGDWVIDSCTVAQNWVWDKSDALYTPYEITVTACPVYYGIQVTHQPQLSNLKTGDEYASNYYYESIEFTFSGGRLVYFGYTSPLDIVDVVNENVQTKTFEEIMDGLKTQLRLYDATYYIAAASASVEINQVELGLARIRIKNNYTDFYLVPAYTFYGDKTTFDASGNEVVWYDMDGAVVESDDKDQFSVINAVDGSVIDVSKGY